MRQNFDMRCGRCGRESDGFCQHCAALDRIVAPVTYQMLVSQHQYRWFKFFKMLSHKMAKINPLKAFTLNMRAENLRKKSAMWSKWL